MSNGRPFAPSWRDRFAAPALALLAFLVLAATTAAGSTSVAAATSTGGICHTTGTGRMVLPDPGCTPGATNPEVTQGNIKQTICKKGWTKTVRPSESYTEQVKKTQLKAYGDSARQIHSYEEDHLVPLEVGGAPSDPHNLWPEWGATPNPKDKVEDAAKRAVCSGNMSLATAQQGFESNWIVLGQQLGVTPSAGPGSTPAPAPPPPAPIAPRASQPAPAGATAQCSDGTYSYSQSRSGTCSGHGGVQAWLQQVQAPAPAPAPAPASQPAAPAPAGATAQCNDGTYSFSQHRSGTCSGHGGVQAWQ